MYNQISFHVIIEVISNEGFAKWETFSLDKYNPIEKVSRSCSHSMPSYTPLDLHLCFN